MVGVDEVGRGSWAGPLLVVAARAISDLPNVLTDSKLLNRKQRLEMLDLISITCQFGEGWVSAREIDQIGMANALRRGVKKALSAINALSLEEIVIDGSVNYIPSSYESTSCMVGADLKLPIVSAASIYAKVTRDKFMQNLGLKYPKYAFEKHVGYGTKAHQQELKKFGILPAVHRKSFRPIRIFNELE